MSTQQIKEIIQILINKGIRFENGLTEEEVLKIELKFNIKFPPDYELFLLISLPVSENFVNWRDGLHSEETADKIFSRLNWPLEGLLFDLHSNDFWIDTWGYKPDNFDAKVQIAKQHFIKYPKLIPIYSHRYIPSQPNESGNPIFSVHQMDIIYYGYDLATYFANEFNFALPGNFNIPKEPIREIEFWSNCADNN